MSNLRSQNLPREDASPIVKTIEIAAPCAVVFDMFVSNFGDWWPRARFSRTRGSVPQRVVLEARADGAIYEVAADGTKLPWGSVTAIEHNQRIVMDWHLGRPVSTVVDVTFAALAADRTLVRLEHRGWEKLEAAGASVERQGYAAGWDLVLQQAFVPFIWNREARK
jgi:uncharacterized protein YndB with AHSA1/START domain